MSKITEVAMLVEEGRYTEVEAAVQAALDEGNAPLDVLNEGLVAPINILGEKFKAGEIYVPELLIAAKGMKLGVEVIRPLLVSDDIKVLGRCLFCTVEGDMHDIGKNLVTLLCESAGFEVVDLGMDVPPDEIVEAIEEDPSIQILGMSAMLTTTMYAMKETIEALEEAGLRDKVKVMVGGAPLNQPFADEIGADGYSPNAPMAVELAKQLLA